MGATGKVVIVRGCRTVATGMRDVAGKVAIQLTKQKAGKSSFSACYAGDVAVATGS